MIVTLNLFGKAILVRKWRRIGAGGRLRLGVCDDIAAAGAALNDLAHRKHRGGYTEL
jgi:predicted DNA-binding WGR domain protein